MMPSIIDQIASLRFPALLPERLLVVEQTFDATRLDDLERSVAAALESAGFIECMPAGSAVSVGMAEQQE